MKYRWRRCPSLIIVYVLYSRGCHSAELPHKFTQLVDVNELFWWDMVKRHSRYKPGNTTEEFMIGLCGDVRRVIKDITKYHDGRSYRI
jgi:hypothetical protein